MAWGHAWLDCKTVVFFYFRKARSAVSVILACEAREPHTPVERVRRVFFRVSPHSPSPFLHSLQAFRLNIILPCRLRSQKIRLFCSLMPGNLMCTKNSLSRSGWSSRDRSLHCLYRALNRLKSVILIYR